MRLSVKILGVCMLFLLGLFYSCDSVLDNTAPEILSFELRQNENAVLSNNYIATIDQDRKVIEIALPKTLDGNDRKNLTAHIVLSPGASLIDNNPKNFTLNPVVYSITNAKGQNKTYLVNVIEKHENIDPKSLIFSEYFANAVVPLKGDNNQYIEITNVSNNEVPLDAFHLKRIVWENGVRRSDKDISIRLTGNIDAKGSFVIYSRRLNTNTYSSISNLSSSKKQSDIIHNDIISASGQDCFQLLLDGRVVDVIGPNDGQGNGLNWGVAKLMSRKYGKEPSTVWNEYDWITKRASVDATSNAGSPNVKSKDGDKKITYFAFENLEEPLYGEINNTSHTISLSIPEEVSLTQYPTVSTDGSIVLYNGEPVVSGQTYVDFSNPVYFTVLAEDGSSQNYETIIKIIRPTRYTQVNYDFDGNITTVLSRFPNITQNNTEISFTDTYVEGILTAKDIYFHADAQQSFVIQDKNAGLFFFNNTKLDSSLTIGSKVRVKVLKGKVYYDMPEVTGIGEIEKIGDEVYEIYYETEPFYDPNVKDLSCMAKTYKYEGGIESAADNYVVGTFSASKGLYFHTTSEFRSVLKEGKHVEAYGPMTISFDQFRMEINRKDQIK
ncbi:MAG: hypothetical protein GX241_06525 [Ruminococcaceae bacterium]|nr:hypothetical protein [Oscillospiraceae bacterium]